MRPTTNPGTSNSMCECTRAAAECTDDELDQEMTLEERRMVDAGLEWSLWWTALDREQRRRIAAGRAIVCAEPALDGTARFPIGSAVMVCVNAYRDSGTYRGEVVRHNGRNAVVRYKQVNGKYVTREFTDRLSAPGEDE